MEAERFTTSSEVVFRSRNSERRFVLRPPDRKLALCDFDKSVSVLKGQSRLLGWCIRKAMERTASLHIEAYKAAEVRS